MSTQKVNQNGSTDQLTPKTRSSSCFAFGHNTLKCFLNLVEDGNTFPVSKVGQIRSSPVVIFRRGFRTKVSGVEDCVGSNVLNAKDHVAPGPDQICSLIPEMKTESLGLAIHSKNNNVDLEAV